MAGDPALCNAAETALSDDPLTAARDHPDAVLAVITDVTGPSYRPPGQVMAFCGDRQIGSLSSGCVETDLARHARTALRDGPQRVRYGEGSPWFDLRLPCGGGLGITLLPRPDRTVLRDIAAARAARRPVAFQITDDLRLTACAFGPTAATDAGLRVGLLPDPRFLIFGQGAEAQVFAQLVRAAGYPHLLMSPDPATLAGAKGCDTRVLHWPALPTDLEIDARTAVILFFHDHDWEPPILSRALNSDAFYIGAQGSLRARQNRLDQLRASGVVSGLDRLHGPIGMIPSAKDPRVLAASVLAEVLEKAL